MLTFDDFRNRFPSLKDASDEEIIEKASKVFKMPTGDVMEAFGYELNEPGITSDLKRSAGQAIGSFGSTLRDIGAPDVGASMERYGKDVAFKNPSEINSFSDVVQNPGTTAREAVSEAAPQVALSLGTGTAGGVAGRYVGGAIGSLAGPGGTVAGAVTGGYLGFKAGQFLGNFVQEYGGIRTEQRDAGIDNKPRALAAAGGAALLDTGFGVEGALGQIARSKSLNILSREAGSSLLKNVGKQAAIGGGTEFLTEGGQTALERWGAEKDLTGSEALNEYAVSAIKGGIGGGTIRGGMSAFAGERKAEGAPTVDPSSIQNEFSQQFARKDATQPDIVTNSSQATLDEQRARFDELNRIGVTGTPGREVVTEDGEIIRVPGTEKRLFTPAEQKEYVALKQQFAPSVAAPAVSGGSTDIAVADQQAKQQAEQQQAQAAQAQAAQQAAEQFGVVNPDTPAVGNALGQKVYGANNIQAVSNALATVTSAMPPHQVQLAQAIAKANAETGGQLIKFQFNANDVMASVNKGMQAVSKVATQLQIDHVQTVEEAAAILNDQSEQAKGDKLEQLNAIFQALTGQNTNGYEAAQLAQLAKGAKDDKLQLQNNAGLREVPVSGGATEASTGGDGGVRPTQVQPVGATSVGAGPLDIQAGQPSAGGVRPSAGNVPNVGGGEATPQVSEATDGQETTESGQATVQPTSQAEAVPSVQQAGEPARAAEEVKSDEELLADQAEEITAEVMELLIPVHQRMTGATPQERAETAQRLRDFTFGILMNGHYDTLAVMAKDFGISFGQAKDWSAKALAFKATPEFLQKLKAAYEVAASKRGLTIPELLTRIEAKANAAISDKMEVDKSISTSREQGGPRDSDERVLNVGFDAEGRDTGEVESNEGLAIKSRKSGESVQERFNAVETNQASVAKILKMLDEIQSAQTNTQEFSEARVAGALAKYEAALVNGTPVPQDSLFVLAYDAMQKGNEGEAAMYVEELEAIRDDKLAKATEQAKKQTNKSADLNKPEKETKDAVQKRSTKKVPVQERTGDSEALGEGNAEESQAATEGKTEAKQEVAVLTPVEKYEAIAADYPLVPPYESLTEAEQARWDDLANRTEVDVTDIARIVGTAKATQQQQVENDRTIDGTGLVREITPEQVALLEAPVSKLTEGQTVRLERHYGAKRGTSEFFTKLHDDIALYAAKGVEAVNAAVRDIVKAIYTAVLAVAVVFNPTYMNKAEAYTFSPAEEYSVTKEVRAEAPAEAASKMSPAAKEAYATLMPALKAELTAKDKLLVMADKPSGRIFVFTPDGKLVVEKKSLFGLAKGDFYKGNNDLPSNRITPAGLHDIVMVDAAKGGGAAKTAGEYDFGKVFGIVDKNPGVLTIMHSVWLKETDAPKRAAALKSESSADSRFSFGCINVDKVTYKNLIDTHGQQMDGAKLFVVPDNQERLSDFVTGKVAQNLTNEDKLVRQAVTPITETTKGIRQNANQVAAEARNVVGKEEQAPINEPAQQAKTTQQSRRRRGKGEKYTPEMLKASLLDFMNRSTLGKEVVVVDDLDELREHADFADMADVDKFFDEQGIDYDTQAFVYKGKAYMLAGNIALGTGRGVFMHEVGGHLGIQQGLSREQISRLASRVELWAKNKDGSIESTLAAHAISRMKASKTEGTQARQNETIAYFLEAAVNAGINPTAASKIGSAGLREWMRTLWAAFKNALRMVRGVNIDKVTAQDLVDLAYGYAQMSATRFHGSNANFRKFLTKFMNSGAGGQQYGWGTYFAEARPTAEGYSVPEMDAPAGTRSHLYTIDLAIAPEEMILWNKPMSEQSALVQAAAAKHPAKSMYTGMDFYKGTSERLYEEKYGVEPTTKAQRTEAEMMASQFMDSLGIKGIQYLDATTATRDTSNFVVFNEDNIIRVQTETGLASDRQAMRPDFTWERVQQSRADKPAGMFSKAGEWLDDAMTNPGETLRKVKLGFLTLGQLASLDKTPNQVVRGYATVSNAMQNMSKDMVARAAQIDQLWAKLSPSESTKLSQVMRDATRLGFDPDKPHGPTRGETAVQAQLVKDFNALNPSAVDVYRKVRKFYEDSFNTRLAIMRDVGGKLGGKALEEIDQLYSQLQGPYFPLGRTGRYYAVGMSPRVSELMDKKEAGTLDRKEARELVTLRKDPTQYQAHSFDSLKDAKKKADELRSDLGYSYHNVATEKISTELTNRTNFAKLEEHITTQLGGDTRAEVHSMLSQMMFDMLPEHHALKRQMKREGIHGEDTNMRRVFAQTSISQAHYISRLKYSNELDQAMRAISKVASRDITMREIENELKLRTKLAMDNTQSAAFDAMVNASYFAHLGMSPAFLLTNMTQVPMITAPWLGARHGLNNTRLAMANALVDTADMIKTTYKNGDWRSELNWNEKFPVGSNEDKLFHALLAANALDITVEHDLAAVAAANNSFVDKKIEAATKGNLQGLGDLAKFVNTPVRVTELANRAVTALAAYRLKMEALKTAGLTDAERHAVSVDYTIRAIEETQLNYSEANAPRHMRQVFGSKQIAKLVYQFRKFQQGMLYLVAKNIMDSLPSSSATKYERRIARRTIAGLYITTGLMAGTTGMPLMGTVGVAGIMNILMNIFREKDEPWDFETEYRNFLTDWLGHDMALLVAKGIPAAVFKTDLSGRIGLADVAHPLPFVQRGTTGASTIANVMYAAGGAPIGMGGTMYDGLVAMANGDVLKGLEKTIPLKEMKDLIRAYRYSDEGLTDKRGNVILPPEKFSTWDLALRSMGFTPTIESEYYAANNAIQEAKTAATDTRNLLLRRYSEARIKGDELDAINEKIADFNERHPEDGIRIDMSAKLRATQQRRKMANERTDSGVRVGKREKPFASEARFATEE